MKNLVTIIILGLIITNHLEARLGETRQQLESRYGKPISDVGDSLGELALVFRVEGFQFAYILLNGVSQGVLIRKYDTYFFEENEVTMFMKKNSLGSGYEPDNFDWYGKPIQGNSTVVKQYREKSSGRRAYYEQLSQTLAFMTQEYVDYQIKKEKRKQDLLKEQKRAYEEKRQQTIDGF